MPGRHGSNRAAMLAGAGLGCLSFAYLTALPPTLNPSDESFLLYGAKRILQGDALYRDFFDFTGPGSFYLYAVAFAVGGTSVTTAHVTTSLLHAVGATCAYVLALRCASMGEALLAGLFVTVVCGAAWNLASHNWVATTFGLAAAAVLLAGGWQDSSRARPAAAGALAGALACTHQTRGLAIIAWMAIAVPALAFVNADGTRWRRCLRELWWAALGAALVCVAILGYAVWRSSLAEMTYATHTWVLTSYRKANVGKVEWGGARWAVGPGLTFMWLIKAVPLLLGVESAALLWAAWQNGVRAEMVRGLLLLLAVLACASTLYFPDYVHVLFVMPFALVVLAGMAYRLRVRVLPAQAAWGRVGVRVAGTALAAVVAVKAWSNASFLWRENPVVFDTAFGAVAGAAGQAAAYEAVRQRVPPDGGVPPRLFAYPLDAWLYLVLPADNPTPFALLRPEYNTSEQVATAIRLIEVDARVKVLVNQLYVKPGDPVRTFLTRRFRNEGPVGPWYQLFSQHPGFAPRAEPGVPGQP